jgi:hypothetical protein
VGVVVETAAGFAGGGGAGGFLTSDNTVAMAVVTGQAYPVIVGAGGARCKRLAASCWFKDGMVLILNLHQLLLLVVVEVEVEINGGLNGGSGGGGGKYNEAGKPQAIGTVQ